MDALSDILFSSRKDNWTTPKALFSKLNGIYAFDLDVAADADNALCGRYCSIRACDTDSLGDGLSASWEGARVWCNPPYGRQIGQWVAKAVAEQHRAAFIVMLVPARTDTAWWHEATKSARVELLRGRLKFGDSPNSAPFPSALLYWNC